MAFLDEGMLRNGAEIRDVLNEKLVLQPIESLGVQGNFFQLTKGGKTRRLMNNDRESRVNGRKVRKGKGLAINYTSLWGKKKDSGISHCNRLEVISARNEGRREGCKKKGLPGLSKNFLKT